MEKEELEDRLKRAKRRIDAVNKIRVFSLLFAALLAALLYFGHSYFENAAFYQAAEPALMNVAYVFVWIVVITTFLKFPLIAAHNRIVRELK